MSCSLERVTSSASPPTLIFILIILNFCVGHVKGYEWNDMGFTFQRLVDRHSKEEKISGLFETRLSLLNQVRKIVKNYLNLYKNQKIGRLSQLTPKELLGYSIVWRFFSSLSTGLKHFLRSSAYLNNQEEIIREMVVISTALIGDIWRGSHEMMLSYLSWIHFQEVNQFTAQDISNGLTIDTTRGGRLKRMDALELALFTLYDNRYSMSVEWMETILKRDLAGRTKGFNFAPPDLVHSFYSLMIQEHNKAGWKVFQNLLLDSGHHRIEEFFLNLNPSLPEKNPFHVVSLLSHRPIKRMSGRQIRFEIHKQEGDKAQPTEQFMETCMGHRRQSSKLEVGLKCYYDHKKNPYFQINPLKVEHLSENPPLYQFYDVMTNSTIDWFKTRPKNDTESRKCWMQFGLGYASDSPNDYYKWSEMLAGLEFTSCPWHAHFIQSTYGRMQWVHNDWLGNETYLSGGEVMEEEGDYIATLLYILEAPTLGGETALLPTGVYGNLVRGSAIFWLNMYRNGSVRQDAIHGGCPVLHGHKIIMTHFFRYKRNWKGFQCTLNPLE